MPRRLLRAPDHDRARSLGWLAVWWIETFTVRGPGDAQGEPVRYGDEFTGFYVDAYGLTALGRRLYDSVFFSRPKGCDKSGIGAALCLFEALGPCRFAGWAEGGETYTFLGETYTYKPGEPMGKPITSPYVRVMATEEGQTGNVYDVIYFNLTDDNAPLSQLKAYGMDAGLTRVLLPFGGEIMPSTSGAASKDGGKETFVCFDESHLYNTPVLRKMYNTVSRNLPKRGKVAQPWSFEPTTMYQPGEDSIAEQTYKLADQIEAGKARRQRLLFDHRWGDIELEHLLDGNEKRLREQIIEAYGDAIEWNDVESVIDKIFDPRTEPEDAIRYYLNALAKAVNAWLDPVEWTKCLAKTDNELQPRDVITLGFDGSETNDATALVACRVRDRLLVPLLIDQQPDGPEAKDWRVDKVAVDAAVSDAFRQYRVVAFFADPPHWQDEVDKWTREFAGKLKVNASSRHPIAWWTKLDVPMANALERLKTAIKGRSVRHSGDRDLTNHFLHARKWKRRGGTVIGKETPASSLKIDGAMAATLAFEAAAQYLVAGKKTTDQQGYAPRRLR